MESSAQDYIRLDEVAKITGIAKANLHYHLRKNNITPRHFEGRASYILREEAERIRDANQQPWKRTQPGVEQEILATLKSMEPYLLAQALVKLREMVHTEQPDADV